MDGITARLEQSQETGLDMISELESRRVISREDISGLVHALNQCNFGGIASEVEYSYQSNVSSHIGSPPSTLKGKQDTFDGKDVYIVEVVKALCARRLIIGRDDSKVLHKVRLLEIASRYNIPIAVLRLNRSFSKVDNNTITLRSGIVLPSLLSLEKLLINSGGDKPGLTEDEFAGLINYVIGSKNFKTLWFLNCTLPGSLRPGLISDEAKSRNIQVLWPSNASKFDLKSGQWKKADDSQTITEMCSTSVAISNKDSVPVQRSAIELLVKASNLDIPIDGASLNWSFKEVDKTGKIILHSGLSLPILKSVESMGVQTEEGREMNEQEVIGILNYAQHSKRLKTIQFVRCLLPLSIHLGPSLSILQSRKVKVFWDPYGQDTDYYKLNQQNGFWTLSKGDFTKFPMKKVGDVLTVKDYNAEKRAFRHLFRNSPWQQRRVVSREGRGPTADD